MRDYSAPVRASSGGNGIDRGDGRRWRGEADPAGTDDDALEGAIRLNIENVDEVAFAAGLQRLAARGDQDAGNFVDAA